MRYQARYHPGQARIHKAPARFKVVVSGRRFGKTHLGINTALEKALKFPRELNLVSPEVVLITMPTRVQAKGIIWEPLVKLCEDSDLKHLKPKINRSDFTISFPGKPTIYVVGANDRNGDGLRGKKIWFLWADEYQDISPGVFDTILRPAMADCPGSTGLFTGTPKGKLNHLYEMFLKAQTHPDEYQAFNLPTSINPHVPREELETARKEMPPRLYRQEFEASFEEFPGKIFYELDEANLCDYVPDGRSLTVLGVDWGDTNPAVVALRLLDSKWYVLEGWWPREGVPVPSPLFESHISRLAKKYDAVQVYCDPSRPSSILSLRTLGKEHDIAGLKMSVAGFNPIEEGLNQVHSLIYQKRLLFPTKAIKGPEKGYISPYEIWEIANSYRRPTDRNGTVLEGVEEGQPDHVLDAIRYGIAKKTG